MKVVLKSLAQSLKLQFTNYLKVSLDCLKNGKTNIESLKEGKRHKSFKTIFILQVIDGFVSVNENGKP